jgi:hypothetical protein
MPKRRSYGTGSLYTRTDSARPCHLVWPLLVGRLTVQAPHRRCPRARHDANAVWTSQSGVTSSSSSCQAAGSRRLTASIPGLAISTMSCFIAYPRSSARRSAAARASSGARVVLEPLDLAVRPCGEVRHPLLDATFAADQAAALPKDAKHDAVPEIEELLLLIHRVGGKQAHHHVKVTATHGLVPLSRKPRQVGGRGLLWHPPLSIPDRRFPQPSERLAGLAPSYRASGRGESHPPALSEPGVSVSAHRAPIVQPSGRVPNRQ